MKASRSIVLLIVLLIAGCGSDPVDVAEESFTHRLDDLFFATSDPAWINLLFQVTDDDGRGVTDVALADLRIDEDDTRVDPALRYAGLHRRDRLDYRFRTVLMLDVSSLMTPADLDSIRTAARAMVAAMDDQQEIAICTFYEQVTVRQAFTDDPAALNAALDAMQVDFGSYTTNLNGAVIEGVQMWADSYGLDQTIEQGFMVLLTISTDDADIVSLEGALAVRGNKRVYTIGLGDRVDGQALGAIGNRGYRAVADNRGLRDAMLDVQADMIRFADAFYYLHMLCNFRDDDVHTLTLRLAGNDNGGETGRIDRTFSAVAFYSQPGGVLVEAGPCNPGGYTELAMLPGAELGLTAVSHLGEAVPVFDWTLAGSGFMAQSPPAADTILLTANGAIGQTALLTVTDTANLPMHEDFSRSLPLSVVDAYEFGFAGGVLPSQVQVCAGWRVSNEMLGGAGFALQSSPLVGENSRAILELPVPANTDLDIEMDWHEATNNGALYLVVDGVPLRVDETVSATWTHFETTWTSGAEPGILAIELRYENGGDLPAGMVGVDNLRVGPVR